MIRKIMNGITYEKVGQGKFWCLQQTETSSFPHS